MKKVDLHILPVAFLAFILTLFGYSAKGQDASIQFIHNGGATMLSSVDVYIDGNKIKDDFAFRTATGLIAMAPGTHLININAASSVDSGDQAFGRWSVVFGAGSGNVFMIVGVDDTGMYAANPDGKDISVRLIHRKEVEYSAPPNRTLVGFFHGSTDATGIDIISKPSGTTSLNIGNIWYGDTTTDLTIDTGQRFIEVRDTGGVNILASYLLPANMYTEKSLVVFASGFMTPANNQAGATFGLFATDTSGNTFALTEGARVQFIHNSPDVMLDSIDIWMYNTASGDSLVIRKLGFRKATTMRYIPAGTYDVIITQKNSVDTTGSSAIYRTIGQVFQATKTYLGLTSGVVDPNLYAPNPSAIDRSFALDLYDNYSEGAPANTVELFYAHGVPDGPAFTIDRGLTTPVSVFGATDFKNAPVSINLAVNASSLPYVLIEKIGTTINRTYRLNLAGNGARSAVLFASGFFDTTGNAAGAKLYQYYLALTNGSVINITALVSNFQIVHASADASIAKVDVYFNNVKVLNDFSFRSATPYLPVSSYKTYQLTIAPENSTNAADGFYNTTITPDSGKYYYIVATGLRNPGSYAANPAGIDRSFTLAVNSNARVKAFLNAKNVDLLYFHSMSDAPSTTIIGTNQIQFLSKNDPYKAYNSGYRLHSSLDEVQFDVKNAANDSLLFTGYGNFALRKGLAGLVYASGFIQPSNNLNGDSALMLVVWPDGDVDTIGPKVATGIAEEMIDKGSFTCYPNPAFSNLNIDFESHSSGTMQMLVMDITGKVMMQRTFDAGIGKNKLGVNVEGIPSGFYFVQLISASQTLAQKISITR